MPNYWKKVWCAQLLQTHPIFLPHRWTTAKRYTLDHAITAKNLKTSNEPRQKILSMNNQDSFEVFKCFAVIWILILQLFFFRNLFCIQCRHFWVDKVRWISFWCFLLLAVTVWGRAWNMIAPYISMADLAGLAAVCSAQWKDYYCLVSLLVCSTIFPLDTISSLILFSLDPSLHWSKTLKLHLSFLYAKIFVEKKLAWPVQVMTALAIKLTFLWAKPTSDYIVLTLHVSRYTG